MTWHKRKTVDKKLIN